MRILLLEDDFSYKESIKETLEEEGYEVDDFDDGEAALDAAFSKTYHLFLLDVRVPKIDGYEILKHIKEHNLDAPVIFITSLTDINNLSLGYELGCNDYIRKPFSLKELKYRVKAAINTYHLRESIHSIELGFNFSYDPNTRKLFKNGAVIPLSEKESALLFCLIKNDNAYVNVEQLREYVWEGKYVGWGDIRMAVKKLRDKTDKNLIINQKGIGYKIVKK